jgi:hypothetical protein
LKTPSLSDIKKELQLLSPQKLQELALTLAKYKKDNKEFLAYLLFDSSDKQAFVVEVKAEIDLQFSELGRQANLYYAKKSLRKILRNINKYCKYIGDKAIAAELHIYFCDKLRDSGIRYKQSQLLVNMYAQELKKINTLIASLHEDLRSDFSADLERITE